jgi:hypothetical protein
MSRINSNVLTQYTAMLTWTHRPPVISFGMRQPTEQAAIKSQLYVVFFREVFGSNLNLDSGYFSDVLLGFPQYL